MRGYPYFYAERATTYSQSGAYGYFNRCLAVGRLAGRLRDRADLRHLAQRGLRLGHVGVLDRAVLTGDDHGGRAQRALGEGGLQRVEAARALGGVAERAEHGRLAAVLRDPDRADEEDRGDHGDRHPGAAGDAPAVARPARVGVLEGLDRGLRRIEQGPLAGPEAPSADDREDGRQQRDRRQHDDDDADGVDRADGPGRGELGDERARASRASPCRRWR